nr:restriction endonuclease [Escherichia coli]
MLPSETMIWQPEFTDKTLSRKPGAVQRAFKGLDFLSRLCYLLTKSSKQFPRTID